MRGAMGAEGGIAEGTADARPVVTDSGRDSILEAGAVALLETTLLEVALLGLALLIADCVAPRAIPVVALSASCATLSGRSV